MKRFVTLATAVVVILGLAAPGPAEAARKRAKHRTRVARISASQKPRRAEVHDLARPSGGVVTEPTPEELLREQLTSLWGDRALSRGTTAVYVVDAATGRELAAIHSDDKLNPASNVKLISTATVLDALGPDWRYVTRVIGASPDSAGAVHGSIYLHGAADPTFGPDGLAELAQAVHAAGVKKIDGDVVLSDDLLRDGLAGAGVTVHVRAAGRPGQPADVWVTPHTGFVVLHAHAQVSKRKRARLDVSSKVVEDKTGAHLVIDVGGALKEGQDREFDRSVGRRSTFTGYLLREALISAGVEVGGQARLAEFDAFVAAAQAAGALPVELARHESAPIAELITKTNKRSINWLADRMIMTAGGLLAGEAPAMKDGVAAMRDWLRRAGVDPEDLVVDTGSGLSHATQLTARQLVRVLRVAVGYAPEPAGGKFDTEVFKHSLSIGGVDGTLRGRFHSDVLRGQVIGKTGTLNNAVALSGFVTGKDGRALCFSIVTNGNRHGARFEIRRDHEAMVAAMRRYLDAEAGPSATTAATALVGSVPAATAAASEAGEDEPMGDELGGDEPTTADPTEQPAPATTQPAPATTQPAPATTQPAPATTQPAPVTASAAPVDDTHPARASAVP